MRIKINFILINSIIFSYLILLYIQEGLPALRAGPFLLSGGWVGLARPMVRGLASHLRGACGTLMSGRLRQPCWSLWTYIHR